MKQSVSREEKILQARVLKTLLDINKVDKILSTFIPAFKKALPHEGRSYLLGSFNLGGTVSGRLSSSRPNLQQTPSSGTPYAKAIKQCFSANEGWLMVGIDFSSLEDRVDALLTKDTNKMKTYLDGYDGHSLRAVSYFKDKMPDIELAKDTEKCYKANVDGTDVWLKESDTIIFNDIKYTGKEFYEMVTST